jgi:hypothetical protein
MGALAAPIAGGVASGLVGGLFSKGGSKGNSGSYQENTPYVPRPRPEYMPTQQQYMMPSYYSPVSYGRYQAPAQAPMMPQAQAPMPGMLQGGMNLIDIGLPSMDNLGASPNYLQNLIGAGVDPKTAVRYMMMGGLGGGLGNGQQMIQQAGGPAQYLGLDQSKVINIGGKPYYIS